MNDLKHYKFGLFYFNPDDERLLVPRKLSRMAGYTVNFAKPISYLFLAIFIVITLAAIYFVSTILI